MNARTKDAKYANPLIAQLGTMRPDQAAALAANLDARERKGFVHGPRTNHLRAILADMGH